METIIESVIPTIEIEEDYDDTVVVMSEPSSLPLPGDANLTKMDSYDEDLNANPFFQSFMVTCPDLFSQCVLEQWLICVPRRDSLPKYAFTLEDFAHHILRPLPKKIERQYSGESLSGVSTCLSNDVDGNGSFNGSIRSDSSCSGSSISENNYSSISFPTGNNGSFLTTLTNMSNANVSNISNLSNLKGNWNYRTLSHVNVEYSSTSLILDIEIPLATSGRTNAKEAVEQLTNSINKSGGEISTESLIISPEQSEKSSKEQQQDIPRVQLRKEVLFEETFYTNERQKYKVLCVASPLNSKVDIEDDNFGNPGLGLWNLTSLRDCIDFLWVQKDLVNTLYLKCLNYAVSHGECGVVSPNDATPENYALNDFLMQRLKLSTETYVLNGIYRSLISALTSFVSEEDARLNKIVRNLSELHPQDLDISNFHWDNLARARQELGRLNTYASPLGKLTCMKRTLRYLRPEPYADSEGCPLSADELIPIWVYLVVKNPLGNWMAQLEFLRHFRFSSEGLKDNENSFYITTLEASLEHLRSGKVLGISENECDVGMPCDLGEAWLQSVHARAMEVVDSPLGEMFDVIRLGNCPRLEELIDDYEAERRNQPQESPRRSIDVQGLCHPLCQCERCVKFMRKSAKKMEEEKMPPATCLKTRDGLTMLHVACIYGRPKIVEFLIEAGAQLEAQDTDGMTSLHFSASRGHQNALLLLLDAGANIEPRNVALNTPLHLAAQNGHVGCVKALIYDAEHSGKKLHVSARNQKGDTPLHFSSRWGFTSITQILVEHGAAIRIHNIRHVTPLDCAHDIHILKILQRSLRRRSLVELNHGDFINIEMVQKEECGGIVMLITEPKESPPPGEEIGMSNATTPAGNNNRSGNTSRNASRPQSRAGSRVPSRRTSVSQMPELIPSTATPMSGVRSRKTSTIVNPMKGISEETTKCLQTVADHLEQDLRHYGAPTQNNNYDGMLGVESEESLHHLRKHSVQSLEDCRIASAESAFSGLLAVECTRERDTRKIFTAITHQDFPLALFYLGIPAEELTNPDNALDTVAKIPLCHPLCPCTRCVAKNAGLGLGFDIKNEEGYTPLHVAVLNHLPQLVKILIRFGADLHCQSTHDKKTPLDIAKEKGFHDIEDTLELCGATSTTSFALEEPTDLWGRE
ncbi:Ankyrin repeat domain-containing protein 27 [Orchesella cincta]|uniref:Ankyrin repeat domain-containing protein 27 n=1 Tax=Orchesella cincta TaxID=48709 RepID=A0A1D2MNR4_ORCCI|nr:Ankyrin repeat domain-containing protein 27 [Orchesella cincta]